MKKVLFSLLLLFVSIGASAQTAKELVDSYRGKDSIQVMDVNKQMLAFAIGALKTEEEKAAMRSVDHMTAGVITSQTLYNEICQKFAVLEQNGYGAMDIDKDGVKAKVYAKIEGEFITEIVLLGSGKGTCMFSFITGKFTEEQIGSLIKL
ncbi:MAG: DUF4252 domain-containing protein [Prevotella sp.]|nr:DUF4252 domain-containing protein [Prevotella sp.]